MSLRISFLVFTCHLATPLVRPLSVEATSLYVYINTAFSLPKRRKDGHHHIKRDIVWTHMVYKSIYTAHKQGINIILGVT